MHALAVPNSSTADASARELLNAFSEARRGVLAIIDTLPNGMPSLRDYISQGHWAYRAAEDEYGVCWRALNALATELLWLANPENREGNDSELEDRLSEIPLRPGVFPILSRDGTSGYTLCRTAFTTQMLCLEAVEKVKLCVPPPRVYSTLKLRDLAALQQEERILLLRRVASYFYKISENIAVQMGLTVQQASADMHGLEELLKVR